MQDSNQGRLQHKDYSACLTHCATWCPDSTNVLLPQDFLGRSRGNTAVQFTTGTLTTSALVTHIHSIMAPQTAALIFGVEVWLWHQGTRCDRCWDMPFDYDDDNDFDINADTKIYTNTQCLPSTIQHARLTPTDAHFLLSLHKYTYDREFHQCNTFTVRINSACACQSVWFRLWKKAWEPTSPSSEIVSIILTVKVLLHCPLVTDMSPCPDTQSAALTLVLPGKSHRKEEGATREHVNRKAGKGATQTQENSKCVRSSVYSVSCTFLWLI